MSRGVLVAGVALILSGCGPAASSLIKATASGAARAAPKAATVGTKAIAPKALPVAAKAAPGALPKATGAARPWQMPPVVATPGKQAAKKESLWGKAGSEVLQQGTQPGLEYLFSNDRKRR